MTVKELETYNRFIESNNSFCHALKNNEILPIDSNIKFELIIYYLKINKKYLGDSITEYKNKLLHLLSTDDFIIDDNYLLADGIILTLDYLLNLVTKIDTLKKERSANRIISFSRTTTTNNGEEIKRSVGGRVVQLNEVARLYYYTNMERSILFERKTTITDETLPYIESTRNYYLHLINDLIPKMLNDEYEIYSLKYVKVLASYLLLYPITSYAKNKMSISYDSLTLPQKEIGIRKTTFDNETIRTMERQIDYMSYCEEQLIFEREKYEMDFSVKENILTRIEQERIRLEKEKKKLILSLFLLKHSPDVYNENLLTYLSKSFEQGNIDINRFFANPIIKFFYIEGQNVEFHCSIRLETLLNMFNPKELIKEKTERMLKKEV